MTDRRSTVDAWAAMSGRAARASGYRGGHANERGRVRSGVASLGAMTIALAVMVAALAIRPSTGPAATDADNRPVTATASDGMFRLELRTPRSVYEPGSTIEPVATLTYLGPEPAIAVQHTTNAVQFRIEEEGGARTMTGGSRSVCTSSNLVKGTPIAVEFRKAGSPTDDAAVGFDLAWYEDPTLTLPVGTWRIVAQVDLGVMGCGGTHHLEVANVVRVSEDSAAGPVVDRSENGSFSLELATPRRTYRPDEAIEPVATLAYLGPDEEAAIFGAGSLLGFEILEVGGANRALYPVLNAVCVPDVIRRDAPRTIPFQKSGAIEGIFDRAWFDDPVLHLPAGTWRIRAYTTISTRHGAEPCGGVSAGLEVENVITVVGDPPAPTPEGTPNATPTAAPTPAATEPVGSSPEPSNVPPPDNGTFRLELTIPTRSYTTADPIEPVATLTYVGPDDTVTFGHAAPAITFGIEQIDGDAVMIGGADTICDQTTIGRDEPITVPFAKSGVPEGPFDDAWFGDPVLRLPAGTWRISARFEGGLPACVSGPTSHVLYAEKVVTVH